MAIYVPGSWIWISENSSYSKPYIILSLLLKARKRKRNAKEDKVAGDDDECGGSAEPQAMPQRAQGKARSIALAIGWANNKIFDMSALDISKNLSTAAFGTTSVCPSRKGKMSRNAKKSASSAIL